MNTETMIKALRILAQDIQSDDGVANACVASAADMIEALSSGDNVKVLGDTIRELAKDNEALRAENAVLKAAIKESLEQVYNDGGAAQKAFWDGFERGAINGAANIRQHWNEYIQLRQAAKG